MKTLLLFGIVLLAGCTSSFDGHEINRAYEVCTAHRGVDYVSVMNGVRCNDGTKWMFPNGQAKQYE